MKIKLKTVLIIALLAITACSKSKSERKSGPDKWTIVTDNQGHYAYINWNGLVSEEFNSETEARKAMEKERKWSDDYDKWKLKKWTAVDGKGGK